MKVFYIFFPVHRSWHPLILTSKCHNIFKKHGDHWVTDFLWRWDYSSHLAAVLENQNIAALHLKCCWVLCPSSLPVVISVEILKWKHPWLLSLIGESLNRWHVFTRGQVRTVFSQSMYTWTGLSWHDFIFPWRQFLCDEWGCHEPSLLFVCVLSAWRLMSECLCILEIR